MEPHQEQVDKRLAEIEERLTKPRERGGVKHDQDKPPMELLDHKALMKIAEVFGYGAKKYGRHNYKGGLAYSRLIGAAYRHLGAFNSGEDTDPESGLSHLGHLGCCVMMLLEQLETHKELDDRGKNENNKTK